MGSLRYLALFALLLSLFFVVSANTSNDATHAKDEVKPSEAGAEKAGANNQPQAAKDEANNKPQATEAEAEASSQPQVSEDEANDVVVEPHNRWGGGCRYGCCGGWMFGRCRYCCRSQAEASEVVEAVMPQPGVRGGGRGCRYGCCGSWRFGRCLNCCSRPQDEGEVVEPQQRGGCWFGCCGSYNNGQCSACCLKKMDTEEEKTKGEAKP